MSDLAPRPPPSAAARRQRLLALLVASCAGWSALLVAVQTIARQAQTGDPSHPFVAADLLPALGLAMACVGAALGFDLAALALWRRWRPSASGLLPLTGGSLAVLPLVALDQFALWRGNQGLVSLVGIGIAEGGAGLLATLEASGISIPVVALALALPTLGAALAAVGLGRWLDAGAPPFSARASATATRWTAGTAAAGAILLALAPGGGDLPRLLLRLAAPDRRWQRTMPIDAEPVALTLRPPLPGALQPAAGTLLTATATADSLPADAPRLLVLIVVESLRADAIDAAVTPHLHRLWQRAERWPQMVAAANATHPSWYALFFGRWPHLWHRLRSDPASRGALPLQLLVRHGYALSAIGGAGLDYYGFEQQVRGQGPGGPRLPWRRFDARDAFAAGARGRADADRIAMQQALAEVLRPGGDRRALLLFLDGTHFPYDWIDAATPSFGPEADAADLRLGRLGAAGPSGLRNRYRRALAQVDTHLAPVLQALAARPDAAVVVTGDHGEEFLEHGLLSHDGELCDVQLRVPLLMAWPGRPPGDRPQMASHVDVMPTILQRLGISRATSAALDGQPLDLAADGGRGYAEVVATSGGSPALAAIVLAGEPGTGSSLGPRLEVVFGDRREVTASPTLHLLRIADAAGRTRWAAPQPVRNREQLLPFAEALRTLYGAELAGAAAADATPAAGEPYRARLAAHSGSEAGTVVAPTGPNPAAIEVEVEVENTGARAWLHDVALGWRYLDDAGRTLPLAGGEPRAALPGTLAPGARARVIVPLRPPPRAALVELDVVREQVTWFAAAGSTPLRLRLTRR